MGLDWDKLVEERNAWVAYNFPDHTGGDPGLGSVLGVVEEIGELAHHHLKEDQAIRGDAEFHQREARDAVGDISVYLMGVMAHYNVRPRPVPIDKSPGTVHQQLLRAAGWVGVLANNQARRWRRREAAFAVNGIVAWLARYCKSRGWDYDQIVTDTWNHVKQRDWIKYPDTGRPPVEEAAA